MWLDLRHAARGVPLCHVLSCASLPPKLPYMWVVCGFEGQTTGSLGQLCKGCKGAKPGFYLCNLADLNVTVRNGARDCIPCTYARGQNELHSFG